ncbi:MAG TPA: thermonuclease family protein [Actinomycetota bacterium]|nr:thermonuclease family protein [Actinomycetota bacterium]
MKKDLAWLLVATLFVTGCSPGVDLSVQAPTTRAQEPAGYQRARVLRVVDGDTIRVRITALGEGPAAGVRLGQVYDVRLLGIDTPETVKPGAPVECFGKEASAATKALLEGRSVLLVKDVEERDQYDRLLRYVYVRDEMVNARLVVNGYAFPFRYEPNVRHAGLFSRLASWARRHERGLWGPEGCDGRRRPA